MYFHMTKAPLSMRSTCTSIIVCLSILDKHDLRVMCSTRAWGVLVLGDGKRGEEKKGELRKKGPKPAQTSRVDDSKQ
jgi:hypothetical protein